MRLRLLSWLAGAPAGLVLISALPGWLPGLLAIAEPLCLGLAALGLAVLFRLRSRVRWLALLAMLPGLIGLPRWLNWRPQSDGALRVLSANANYFGASQSPRRVADNLAFCLTEITRLQPEILCGQDFTGDGQQAEKNFRQALDRQGLSSFIEPAASLELFARSPIRHYEATTFPATLNAFAWADIDWQGRPLRVFNLHLQSYALAGARGRAALEKLRDGLGRRQEQAHIVAQAIRLSPYPVLVCGDFNDVPASNTYAVLRAGGLCDGFVEAGQGLAQSYRLPVPGLRIDYILASPQLRFTRYRHLAGADFLDHRWVWAELEWRR